MDERERREAMRALLAAAFDGLVEDPASARYVVGVSGIGRALFPLPFPWALARCHALAVEGEKALLAWVKQGTLERRGVLWVGDRSELVLERRRLVTEIRCPTGARIHLARFLPVSWTAELEEIPWPA